MSLAFSAPVNAGLVRINELARELGVKAKAIIDLLPGYGVTEKKTHSSSIPADVAEKVRQKILALEKEANQPRLTSTTPLPAAMVSLPARPASGSSRKTQF